jgi:hypothetical protein
MAVPSSTYVNKMERWNDQQTQLLDIIQASLGTVNSGVDVLHTSLGTVITSLDILHTSLGTVNSGLDILHTSLGTVVTSLDVLHTSLGTIIAGVPVGAGENHIGEVGSNTTLVSVIPSVSLVTYTANDCVGGGFAIPGAVRVDGGTGILHSVTVRDYDAKNAQFGVYLFQATSLATYTDNAVLDIADVDLDKCIGWVEVNTYDYKTLSDNSVACIRNLSLPIKAVATTKSIYCVLRTTSTPTYTTTTAVKFTFGILRD